MSEQISRRANNVTSANFDAPFETQTVRFGAGGLNLKDSLDAMEGWSRMTNIWHEAEGEATARPGETPIVTHGGTVGGTTHSVRKLRNPRQHNAVRVYGVNNSVHLQFGDGTNSFPLPGANTFSGNPLALVPHRPTLSGDPWMFIGDSNRMLKVRGDGLALYIGQPAPTAAPAVALGHEFSRSIANFEPGSDTVATAWTPAAGTDGEGTAVAAGHAGEITEGPIAESAGYFTADPGGSPKGGYDNWWGVAVERDLTWLDEVGGPGPSILCSDDDICHVWLKTSDPAHLAEIRLYVIISPEFDATILPGTGDVGGPNSDAYVKAFRPNDYVQFVHARTAQVEAAEQARIYALRDKDSETRGYNDTRPTWEEERAQADPGRARSFQIGLGAHQWVGYGQVGSSFRRGDFQRIGNLQHRGWDTVTGLIVYLRTTDDHQTAISIGVDDWYFMGGFGPDTVEPGAQMYDYRCTHYDPRTGAESNGCEELVAATATTPAHLEERISGPLDSVRRHILVTPPQWGDPAVRQRIYRRGGSLVDDWYYCGENASDGGVFEDTLSDAELIAAPTLPVDHFAAIPTVDPDGNTILNEPLPALWGPIEGMLMGCGDKYRPGHVYFSYPDTPDHWSASGNTEVCPPSEELMNGCVLGHQAFVFSRARGYFLYPNLTGQVGQVTAAPSLCTRGLLSRWGLTVGPGGVAYFVAEDGIFATQGGPEDWLSEAINPLFYGTTVADTINGYAPIDKAAVHAIRLTTWENALYFQYQDLNGTRQVLVYSLLQKFWRHYEFGRAPACLQGEDEDVLLLGGRATNAAYKLEGVTDDGLPIPCTIRTGSASGGRREEKLFGDLYLDADLTNHEITLQVFLNEETHTNLPISLLTALPGRRRILVHAFGEVPQSARSIACELRWTSTGPPPTLYQLGYALTLQPDLTNTRVTNWDDLNSPDEVWLTGVTLDCDTSGLDKLVNVERDFNGVREIIATFGVRAAGRHKFKYSWPAVPAHMVRLRPQLDDAPWLLYRADWIYVQEPPRISQWDIHFENQWDQSYTGLDLYCDTGGVEKRIEVSVDGVVLLNPQGNVLYWPITTTSRRVVHLTLPWGRGHIFRFRATDPNPGLLYTHRWHLQEEPSEQANWNQNFSVLGTRADKWLKAVIFECDTFGQNKQVQVEVDGTVVETLTVNTTGRKVVQLALNQQALGRVWRIFPVDSNPGRLYSAEPLFDEEPFQLDRWETQETNHGLPGWFYPLYAHITLKSTADVVLTTHIQHNQVGDVTTANYTIPATTNQKQRRFLHGFLATKGVLIKYVLTSASPFWLYRDETTIAVQPWGAARAVLVQPFGNDDLDPSRPMTHAVLAAQASGGAPGGPS